MLSYEWGDERSERSWVRRPRFKDLDERTEERAGLGRDGRGDFGGSSGGVGSVGL